MVHRSEFLRDYRLEVATEFHRDGQDAQWASPAGPLSWGDEDHSIILGTADATRNGRLRSAMAVSSDGHLLATAVSSTIRIFEVETKKCVSELEGHPNNVGKLVFASSRTTSGENDEVAQYTLLSICQDDAGRGKTIVVWSLDSRGGQVSNTPFTPFGIESQTEKAMSTIATDLQREHGVTTEELASVRSTLCTAIGAVEKQHRLKALPSASGGLPHYNNTDLFGYDEDGLKVLYLSKNGTTQHGMRPADELPRIIIAGVRSTAEVDGQCLQTLKILQGHTDVIISAAFSPNGKLVASASWDQTFRIWSAETGECLYNIGPTGGQNWVVAFTPSGDQILLSGGGGRDKPSPLALYNTSTGEEVSRLRHPGLDPWLRNIAIHPDGKTAAVINGVSVLLWDLTQDSQDQETSNVVEILKLAPPEQESSRGQARMFRSFASFTDVSFVDGGAKLLVRANDNTIFVWHCLGNLKWRFQRPSGVELPSFDTEMAYVSDGGDGTVIALDGDMSVRFWKL